MFKLHYHTRPEALADTLADLLARRDPARLLQPETVLVPQAGMQTWLVQRIAARHGIAANIAFLRPAAFAWQLLRAYWPELPQQSLFEHDTLRWRLYLLPELLRQEPDPLRRFHLASHLARLFEQYQGYRRKLLDGWQRGVDADDVQAGLWRALVAGAPDEEPRNALIGAWLDEHGAEGAPRPPGLPPRVFAFGCSNVSPDLLKLLSVAARHADLHFLLPTPCREYWGDIEGRREARAAGRGIFSTPDNPLLVSLGQSGREFVAQLFDGDEVHDVRAEPGEPPRDSLLHRVQADVIELAAPSREARLDVVDADDRSIQLHICHSPLREVQVLHDRLLDMLQRDPALEPRDIAVLVPDVATYAPCVEAVFGALAEDDARYIPWSLSDRAQGRQNAIAAMFLGWLELPASRLGLDEVLDTLAVPAVARRAGLDGADLDALRRSAVDAGIVWGEDAGDRVAHGLPAYREFSWAFGRDRVLLGYLRGDGDGDALAHGIAPIGDIEGDRVDAFGQLLHIQRQLHALALFQRGEHVARDWQGRFNQALNALLPERLDDAEQRALEHVRAALASLVRHTTAAGCEVPLDGACVRAFLREALQEAPPRQRFLDGGVSVCNLVPLRNVPFRVICLLGLGAEAYPRRDGVDVLSRIDADALAGNRHRGDRSRREDDRYLFLQTLMAARDVLYLGYTGIDQRDGSEREPSAILSGFLDVVCAGYFRDAQVARAALTTRHPMRPFSPALFKGDADLYTYRGEWRAAAAPAAPHVPPIFADGDWPDAAVASRVTLDDLVRFFNAPQKHFLLRRAGIQLGEVPAPTDPREPLTDGPLRNAQRERSLLAGLLADDTLPAAERRARLLAHGLLPPLALGDIAFETAWATVEPQAERWRERCGGEPGPAQPFALVLPSGRVIEGALALPPKAFAGWVGKAGSVSGWMRWWLTALVARALYEALPCLAFGHGDERVVLPFEPAVPAGVAARAELDRLLDVHEQGCARVLPLPPRSAWAHAREAVFNGKPGNALSKARKAWEGGTDWSERDDAWTALALDGIELFDDPEAADSFGRLAERVYGPLWQAIRDGVRA